MMRPDPKAERAGWLDGPAHVLPVRVYYEDTDFSGLVYHTSYLRFMERGRSEFLRFAGTGHHEMMAEKGARVWTVRRVLIDYLRPARVEDALLVRTYVREIAGARMKLSQSVFRGEEELTRAEVEVCVISRDGRPQRIPETIRSKLQAFCTN
jgi:acyl-CoA thioester hydrolase